MTLAGGGLVCKTVRRPCATSRAGVSRKRIVSRRWRLNCARLGATVEEGRRFSSASLRHSKLRHAAINTYDDHRMAMCFLTGSIRCGIRINVPQCVAKTFPDYFARFRDMVQAVPVIAIDGPSASGKGTVAQQVAAKLGYHYLDSGALYRLLGFWQAQRDGIALDDEAGFGITGRRVEMRFGWRTGLAGWRSGWRRTVVMTMRRRRLQSRCLAQSTRHSDE